MAQLITLSNLQAQRYRLVLNGTRFLIRLKTVPAGLIMDMSINDVMVFRGLNVVSGTPLIPYSYREAGNFIFVSSIPNEEPNYLKFNDTQRLYYLSPGEIS